MFSVWVTFIFTALPPLEIIASSLEISAPSPQGCFFAPLLALHPARPREVPACPGGPTPVGPCPAAGDVARCAEVSSADLAVTAPVDAGKMSPPAVPAVSPGEALPRHSPLAPLASNEALWPHFQLTA